MPHKTKTAPNTSRTRLNFRLAPVLLALLVAGIANGVLAQTWRITPEIRISETYTDNAELSAKADQEHSWVTSITPAIRVERVGPRVNLFIDYRAQNLLYSNRANLNETRNFLTSRLAIEAIENWLFVETRANITQENRSAFAPSAATDAVSANTNRIETRTLQVSPYIRGHFGEIARYQLRLNGTQTETESVGFPKTRTTEWIGRLRSAAAAAKLDWIVDGSALMIRNDVIGSRVDDRVSGSLIYAVHPQMHLSGNLGREQTDFASPDKRNKTTYGLGVEYSPSPRTQFAAVSESRFFGAAHNVFLNHRTPLTAWRLSSTREVSVLPNQLALSASSTSTNLLADLLAASIPDPIARAQAVRRRVEETGASGGDSSNSGFLAERPFIDRNAEASVTILGQRNLLSVNYLRNERRGLGATTSGFGSFAITNDVRRETARLSWTHRLSLVSSLALSLSEVHTTSFVSTDPESTERYQSLFFTTRLSARSSLSFGARHVRFRSTAATAYSENALVGTYSYRF